MSSIKLRCAFADPYNGITWSESASEIIVNEVEVSKSNGTLDGVKYVYVKVEIDKLYLDSNLDTSNFVWTIKNSVFAN